MGAVKVDLGEVGGGGAGNLQQIIDAIYPVGCLYQSFVSTHPKELFGVGEWQQINGYFIRAANDTKTGGEDSVTLTVNQMPSHTHNSSAGSGNHFVGGGAVGGAASVYTVDNGVYRLVDIASTGGGQAHNNMPKYQNVYTWRRIS